ncbi:winged helix DNA-binding domain-containing protein [Streptomyces europaeiscabiei]|uniref:winged helix DNA-binding domain-containing protein n=1 Tax=Streptomyces europaeiscabiei TaxID=146819 RepID=UPI0029BB2C40|nr:winged helix DNA-binding domain-containing protein [Streptomyces europaeiscabiei]MDX3707702.1 winged helix DNA-binding domain-containing protein [Streptomyces europaeiscabiei]MDX3859924.1 winged helix DNA-binding domain-containing protein [Streptomyces europaeiscabiei]MDX3869926.1 winged helix DNA-binding domain-containing protein [Streptomyces europaeiscabiei]
MTNKANQTAPRLGTHALNRATLARQLLLHRAPVSAPAEAAPTEATSTKATGSAAQPPPMSVHDAVTHLLGLQAQNVRPPYYALAARLDGFAPEQLSALMAERDVVRIVTMRSTIHTHTAEDCLSLRPLVQPARERELHLFRKGLAGVDLDRLEVIARELVEAEPRTLKQLREALIVEWPDADPFALGVAARCRLPLVQVTPRGLWGRSGQVALTTAEHWLGRPAEPAPAPETVVRRYLAAFGPASVKDMQSWAGLTRLREAFERLRPELLVFRDDSGTELFDLPDAPRPDPKTPAPPRLLPEFDNLLLSHADRSRVVPPDLKGRSWQGNQAHRTFLVDGFLAGLWKLDADVLTLEPFGRLTQGQRADLVTEAERTLTTLHGDGGGAHDEGGAHDIRFGTVAT